MDAIFLTAGMYRVKVETPCEMAAGRSACRFAILAAPKNARRAAPDVRRPRPLNPEQTA
jgi:hypothetical protein